MTRVKTGTTRKARHNKVLKLTKGYRMTKNRLYKVAHEAMLHAGEYAFHGRKRRKRDLRSLWITRLNSALRGLDKSYTYKSFIADLGPSKLGLDRKILADLAATDPIAFEAVVKKVRSTK
jgi:large subunit ribosomal protein L20